MHHLMEDVDSAGGYVFLGGFVWEIPVNLSIIAVSISIFYIRKWNSEKLRIKITQNLNQDSRSGISQLKDLQELTKQILSPQRVLISFI